MGQRHSKEDLLNAALALAFEDGLSQLTFGRLAKRIGINDRTIVYYFPTKDALITEVVMSMAASLQSTLASAFVQPADDHVALLKAAWPILASPQSDPIFALFLEANGLAAVGREPYRSIVELVLNGWIDWTMGFLTGSPSHRRVEAETAIALVDGLLLLRQLGGAKAAQRAAKRLGIA
jgi:AcrR family transcriptional regulator